MFNYPVFLTLYLLLFAYFCRNTFCWLCQEATNIIQESYMTTDRTVHQQRWNKYREATRNVVFQKKVKELFGENEDDDGNYLSEYSTIANCQIYLSTPAWIAAHIRVMRQEWDRISELNDCFLMREGGSPVKDVMPKSTNDISFKVLTTIMGSSKGLYSTKCKAIWHSLNSKEFRDIFSRTKPDIPAQQFIKQMLRSNSWFECSASTCSYNKMHKAQCPINHPTAMHW